MFQQTQQIVVSSNHKPTVTNGYSLSTSTSTTSLHNTNDSNNNNTICAQKIQPTVQQHIASSSSFCQSGNQPVVATASTTSNSFINFLNFINNSTTPQRAPPVYQHDIVFDATTSYSKSHSGLLTRPPEIQQQHQTSSSYVVRHHHQHQQPQAFNAYNYITQTTTPIQQQPSNSNYIASTELAYELEPRKPPEYQIILHVGHFNLDDINIQLVHSSEKPEKQKKLLVHCFRIDPIHNLAGNYLKKEFKRELLLPLNADSNTIESFYHNEMLTIKCKIKEIENILVQSESINVQSQPEIVQQQQQQRGKISQLPSFVQRATSTETLNLHEEKTSNTTDVNGGASAFTTRSILKTSSKTYLNEPTSQQIVYNPQPPEQHHQHQSRLNHSKSTETNTRLRSQHDSSASTPASRSTSRDSKSVRFDLAAVDDLATQQQQAPQDQNTKVQTTSRLAKDAQNIRDGFNCLTRDSLDILYLTYFFKLPACSPSDRTQAKIEHNNILKLKIIQEKKLRDVEGVSLSGDSGQNDSPVNDADKIILREFSRRCRLPVNLFKFDEDGVTVSFVNDVLVKVDIPIREVLSVPDSKVNSNFQAINDYHQQTTATATTTSNNSIRPINVNDPYIADYEYPSTKPETTATKIKTKNI